GRAGGLYVESQVAAGRVHALIIVANWEFLFPKKRLTAKVHAALCGLIRPLPGLLRQRVPRATDERVPGGRTAMRGLSRPGARHPERPACHGKGFHHGKPPVTSAQTLSTTPSTTFPGTQSSLRSRRERATPIQRECRSGADPKRRNSNRSMATTYALLLLKKAAPAALLTGVAFPAQGWAQH